ncbi:hypothetical protein L1987_21248 [Smallanthus sonchifolius]|uniref:Uncharacterized protein n=1 Tax=Smallanthus sonchifolius TaxID=185202 RepID=A0ACB9ITD1_9ASTR|nr:hypothetical protein L1987_21248 [Smallanthus sonchifolius]
MYEWEAEYDVDASLFSFFDCFRHKQPHKRLSLSAARFYIAVVLVVLEYLIIYRDLKPENVLVNFLILMDKSDKDPENAVEECKLRVMYLPSTPPTLAEVFSPNALDSRTYKQEGIDCLQEIKLDYSSYCNGLNVFSRKFYKLSSEESISTLQFFRVLRTKVMPEM